MAPRSLNVFAWRRREKSMRRARSESRTSDGSIEEKFRDVSYADIERKLRRRIKLKERSVGNVTYTGTFLGNDMVGWLIESKVCASRQEALFVCGQMLREGHIYRVEDNDGDEFVCNFQPYKFAVSSQVTE